MPQLLRGKVLISSDCLKVLRSAYCRRPYTRSVCRHSRVHSRLTRAYSVGFCACNQCGSRRSSDCGKCIEHWPPSHSMVMVPWLRARPCSATMRPASPAPMLVCQRCDDIHALSVSTVQSISQLTGGISYAFIVAKQPHCLISYCWLWRRAKTGRPVKWVESRLEHLVAATSATNRVTTLSAAVDRDGVVIALTWDQLEDCGACLRAPEPATLYRMHANMTPTSEHTKTLPLGPFQRNPRLAGPGGYVLVCDVTRQTVSPTSSAIRRAPVLSTATPTGRPRASPFALRNPVTTSSALPFGRPLLNGTKTTL
jgi:Molybdopterin-binding domain of aldehyde dehydrogenase